MYIYVYKYIYISLYIYNVYIYIHIHIYIYMSGYPEVLICLTLPPFSLFALGLPLRFGVSAG